MAEELTQKKIENLGEATDPVDADVFLHGSGGGNVIKKIKWSNLIKKLRSILFVNNTTTTVAGYGADARVVAQQQKQIDELNTNNTVNYTGYDPSGKFEAIDNSNSWIRASRIGKFANFDAGLKIKTNFGVNTKYRICGLDECYAHQTQCGFAISQLTGKVMLVTVDANENLLYINSQSQTVATGDRLWVHIHYACK